MSEGTFSDVAVHTRIERMCMMTCVFAIFICNKIIVFLSKIFQVEKHI